MSINTNTGILDANQLCQRLHRDISANNIILVRDPTTGVRRGVAIDWELSIKTAWPKVANYTISVSEVTLSPLLLLTISVLIRELGNSFRIVYCSAATLPLTGSSTILNLYSGLSAGSCYYTMRTFR